MKQRKKMMIAGVVVLLVIVCGLGYLLFSDQDEKVDAFPYKFENDQLEINGLITFDGPNPDNDNKADESIASLQLTNHSKKSIKSLTLTLKMEDDQEYEFVIEDLPASKSIVALDIHNAQYDGQTKCKSFDYNCEFERIDKSKNISVTTQNNSIIVMNNSKATINNIDVTYHCLIEEGYFGGKSYHVTIPKLLSGKSETYTDDKCFMGALEVISYEIKK